VVDAGGGRLDSLQVVFTGGAPVPVDLVERWRARFGVAFAVNYGLTEASPVITSTGPRTSMPRQTATVGQPLPHVEVDIVDPDSGARVAVGEQGELRTRSWAVMKGYWGNPEATAAAISPDGFLRTGDLARMDADGFVTITGRAKEMIIRGGENLYPREIEDAIRTLPGVLDVAVVGVPDDRYGEECAAFVRLAPEATIDRDRLVAELGGRIARFKIPRHVRVVDAFPLTPSGKVRKFMLRERFVAEIQQTA
jgi:fatty-acyl-CoA synthase